MGLTIKCSTPESIIQRYEELMEQMRLKGGVAAEEGESAIQLIPALQIQPQQLSFL